MFDRPIITEAITENGVTFPTAAIFPVMENFNIFSKVFLAPCGHLSCTIAMVEDGRAMPKFEMSLN